MTTSNCVCFLFCFFETFIFFFKFFFIYNCMDIHLIHSYVLIQYGTELNQ